MPLATFGKAELKSFATGQALSIEAGGAHWIIDWSLEESEDHERFGMEDGSGWMRRLAPLRDELLRGGLRPLYLGRLAAAAGGELRDDALESEAPPGPHNAPMLTVHHLNNSRSQRVLWLLEELALPYEIVHYQRDPQTMLAPPELRKVHPLGKSPVVTVDGLTLAESGAILETLTERYGNGRLAPAAGTPEQLRYRYWLHYAEGSAMPPLLLKLVFDKIESSKMPFFAKPIAKAIAGKAKASFILPNIKTHLDFMEAELGQSEWFAGSDFSAADIQMSFPVEAARARGGLDATRPKLMAYLERIHARPAFRRALERGGPYDLLS